MDQNCNGTGRKRIARRGQAEAFGQRLQWARKRKGFRTRQDVFRAIPDDWPIAERTYYAHERGERVPESSEVIARYCTFFNITQDFLIFGTGAEMQEFANSGINHTSKQIVENSSQIEGIRFIPILQASDLEQYMQEKGTLATMTKETLPLPSSINAGPNAFAYEIHPDDESMIGSGVEVRAFHPRSFVVIDPDSTIKPGQYLLVKLKDWPYATVRQFKSSRPYQPDVPHFGFALRSANPAILDETIYYSGDCEILGRVVFTIEEL